MACFSPVIRYQLADGSTTSVERGDVVRTLVVPCRGCIGCRLDYARDWSTRCLHESQMHKLNDFITLSYSDEHLPKGGVLNYRDFQLFMKRVRFEVGPVRFYMCGEYGEQTMRPHYHALIFGHMFEGRKKWTRNAQGQWLYRSAQLERLWPFGQSLAGAVTKQSCGYVARYVMKKLGGALATERYSRTDPETGEIYQLPTPFCKMSLRPGIGEAWFRKYGYQVYDRDYVIVSGQKVKPPAYYEKLHDRYLDEVILEQTKGLRDQKSHTKEIFDDNTDERLAVKGEVQLARIRNLKRS